MTARSSSFEENVHYERNLLSAEALKLWSGFPIGWFEARPRVCTEEFNVAKPVLALIDTGTAFAEFGFSGHSEAFEVEPGAMGLFEGGTDIRRSKWECRAVRRIMVELDFQSVGRNAYLRDDLVSDALVQNTKFNDPEIAAVLRAMAREVATGCRNGALFAQGLSVGLAMRLAEFHSRASVVRKERGKLSCEQMRRVEGVIRGNLTQDLSLETLAKAAGFSAPHFTRLFKNTVGCAPHRYVTGKRVDQACELLEHGNLSLAIIAHTVGFASQSHMTEVFSRTLGVTPRDVRRNRRQ
ncbi:MAG TPA: AraC family transcriptional regulator [Burkholderiaceae bacterium]|nr:AraC family transcriptional regulator [Burkholderiaceae bacterium]